MTAGSDRSYLFGDTDLAAARLRFLAEVFAPSTRAFLEELKPLAPGRIGDLGCGPGYTTQLLAEVFPQATVVGLDNSESFVARARQAPRQRIEFAVADITRDLPGGPFDLLYSRYLLTHVARYEETVQRWAGQLAPRGVIAIEENEWIETSEPAFRQYLAIVEAMLADGGKKLYVGAELDAIAKWPGLEKRLSEVVPIEVADPVVANMFVPNLQTWRQQPYVRDHYSVGEITRLEAQLQAIAHSGGTVSSITFGRRRLVLGRAGAGTGEIL